MCVAISLIALALGYKAFAAAHKEKEGLKLLGKTVGLVVMITAAYSIAFGVTKCMNRSQCDMMSKSNCAMMAKKTCPMMAPEDAGK